MIIWFGVIVEENKNIVVYKKYKIGDDRYEWVLLIK